MSEKKKLIDTIFSVVLHLQNEYLLNVLGHPIDYVDHERILKIFHLRVI